MKIKFKHFLRESTQPEISKIDMTLDEIFDSFLTYGDVVEYLNKELKNRKVSLSSSYIFNHVPNSYDIDKEYLRNTVVVVDHVDLAERTLTIIIASKDNKYYHISDGCRLKWEKPIIRRITELDPYGEEEDDDE